MTSFTKAVLAAGALAAAGAVAVAGTSQAGDRHGGPPFGMFGPPHGGFGHMRMLEAYDADGDGKLTQAEIDAGRSERFARHDAGGDSALSLEEFQTLFLEHIRLKIVRAFQRLDPDGDASVTKAEYDAAFADIVQRMDHDGDGALSRSDWPSRREHRDKHDDRDDD